VGQIGTLHGQLERACRSFQESTGDTVTARRRQDPAPQHLDPRHGTQIRLWRHLHRHLFVLHKAVPGDQFFRHGQWYDARRIPGISSNRIGELSDPEAGQHGRAVQQGQNADVPELAKPGQQPTQQRCHEVEENHDRQRCQHRSPNIQQLRTCRINQGWDDDFRHRCRRLSGQWRHHSGHLGGLAI